MTAHNPHNSTDGTPIDGLHIAGIDGKFSRHVQSDIPRCPECQALYADHQDRGLCPSCQRTHHEESP